MSIEAQLIEYFARYAKAFSDLDAEAICQLWQVPAFVQTAKQNIAITTQAEFFENTQALCDFYRCQGVAHISVDILGVDQVFEGNIFVKINYHLYDDNNAKIIQWEHAYSLHKTGGHWLAVMAIADGEVAAWAARGTPLGS